MTTRLLYTHFHVETDTLFNIEECEGCGGMVQAANSVKGCDGAEYYRVMGISIVTKGDLLPEQFWDDTKDMPVCERCLDEEPANSDAEADQLAPGD